MVFVRLRTFHLGLFLFGLGPTGEKGLLSASMDGSGEDGGCPSKKFIEGLEWQYLQGFGEKYLVPWILRLVGF